MREHSNSNSKNVERKALSSGNDLSAINERSISGHNKQLHALILKKQKIIIYLSILYSMVVLLALIFLFFLK